MAFESLKVLRSASKLIEQLELNADVDIHDAIPIGRHQLKIDITGKVAPDVTPDLPPISNAHFDFISAILDALVTRKVDYSASYDVGNNDINLSVSIAYL
jgi:hypothetical protein